MRRALTSILPSRPAKLNQTSLILFVACCHERTWMTHVSAATLEKPQRVKDTVVLSEIVITGSRRRRESEVASNTSESDGIPLLGKFSERRRTYIHLCTTGRSWLSLPTNREHGRATAALQQSSLDGSRATYYVGHSRIILPAFDEKKAIHLTPFWYHFISQPTANKRNTAPGAAQKLQKKLKRSVS